MYTKHELVSDANKMNFPFDFLLHGSGNSTLENTGRSQFNMVYNNIGPRGLFTKTVIMGGVDRVLATQQREVTEYFFSRPTILIEWS